MKKHEIVVSDDTSSLLEAIASAKDDPLLIAELAQVDPTEFRRFLSECGEMDNREASQLLKAAESLERNAIGGNIGHRHGFGENVGTVWSYPRITSHRISPSPFRLIVILNLGLATSVAYGLLSSAFLFYANGKDEAQLFITTYTGSFKTLISLGLIVGTAIFVNSGQNVIPSAIERAFTQDQLSATDYFYYKKRFASLFASITLSAEFVVIGFIIFYYCQFPLSNRGQALMLLAVCAEYALGAYIMRKLMYAGMMLHSLLQVTVKRNLFRKRELDATIAYLSMASTIAVISVCVHVIGYYGGPFLFTSFLGEVIKPFLILPALAAIFVILTISFYPTTVLKKLYERSIDIEARRLKKALRDTGLSEYEKRAYLLEVDKVSRDELRQNFASSALSALPTWISLLITVLGPILRR